MESVDSATWFPDGKRLLVCGAEKGQGPRCYVLDVDGQPRAVTPDNVGDGIVAPDGRHFLARHGGVSSRVRSTSEPARLYSIDGGTPRSIPGLTADDVPVRFAPDGRSLIVTQNIVPAPVSRLYLDTGRREPMYQISPVRTSGIVGISSLVVGDDPSVYAYGFYQFLSRLFVVQGAR
jgi:hypothetical protein